MNTLFIGYMDDDYKIKPFRIILPKTRGYVKRYDVETKWMYFLIELNELLKRKFRANLSTIKQISKNQNKVLW